MIKRSWVEIDLAQIEKNYDIHKKLIGADREVMAVIKANAYGHESIEVAKKLSSAGCRHFAVSNIEEAIELREAGIKGLILILGYTPTENKDLLIEYDISQAILSEEYAEKIKDKRIKAHFALDTGMNRIGLDADDPDECERIIRKYKDEFTLEGIFTHLCVADTPSEIEFTENQIALFKNVAERLKDLSLPYIHCMNSAAGLYQKPYGNLVRIGITMYGLKPDYANILPEGIKPAITWKSAVSMIKKVHKGESIGYGRSFKAEKEMLVATVTTGYADGYSRALSNKGKVIIRGKYAPIVGRICMDQFMVDISDIPEARFEDEVILLGKGYDADDMAHDANTIGYEIVCGITKRVTKLIIDHA